MVTNSRVTRAVLANIKLFQRTSRLVSSIGNDIESREFYLCILQDVGSSFIAFCVLSLFTLLKNAKGQ